MQRFFVALRTIVAVVLAFLVTYALGVRAGTGPAPAVLSAALCVGLMRRPEDLTIRTVLQKLLTLPAVAVAAGAIGLAFLRLPWLGAALFTAGMGLSVALRAYGERWLRS